MKPDWPVGPAGSLIWRHTKLCEHWSFYWRVVTNSTPIHWLLFFIQATLGQSGKLMIQHVSKHFLIYTFRGHWGSISVHLKSKYKLLLVHLSHSFYYFSWMIFSLHGVVGTSCSWYVTWLCYTQLSHLQYGVFLPFYSSGSQCVIILSGSTMGRSNYVTGGLRPVGSNIESQNCFN